jgi:hypothetical protein
MNPKDSPEHQGAPSAWQSSESERLCRGRLREVLGINAAGVEVIMRLRNQVIALQTRMRQLEADITVREAGRSRRLTQHRKAYFEASWEEVVDPEKRP